MSELKGKKMLILGGVPAMVEIAQRAKEFGVEVLVTDYLENSPAKKYADKSFMTSTTDVEAVVELCKEEQVDGIFTGNIDSMLSYYAQICEKTHMPCYGTLEHFNIMTDKKEFKKICKEYNVPVVKDYTQEELEKDDNIVYPVIVKPIDSSGSRGISVCSNREELEKGVEKALSFSPSKQYIVERYMTGAEVVLYYYFQDGNPVFMGMCDRYVNKEQKGLAQLPTSYIFPSRYTGIHIAQVDSLIKGMFKGIGMKNGSIFLQAFIEDGIAYLYEPGYRLNGAREHYIYGAVNDINAADMLINYSLTGKMSEEDIETKADPYIHGKYACKLSPLIKTGTIKEVKGMEIFEQLSSVVKVVVNNAEGDSVLEKEAGTLRQIAYRAFIVCDTLQELKETIDTIQSVVEYFDEDGKSMMLKPFETELLEKNY